MATVLPIKSKSKVYELLEILEKQSDRDALLFHLGINTAMRISDLLKIKYEDIFNKDGTMKTYLVNRMKKGYTRTIERKKDGKIETFKKETHKEQKIFINKYIKDRLIAYAEAHGMEMGDYFFYSYRHPTQPIDKTQAYRRLVKGANKLGIKHFGTHSMRKTLGYRIYMETHNPILVMKLLGHSSMEITLRYIGIEQQEVDEAYQKIGF